VLTPVLAMTHGFSMHSLVSLASVLAKHSKSFALVDAISISVDRIQRNFEPMRNQVEARR
jgi:hypothetical protein